MYKVTAIKKEAIQCEINSTQVNFILQKEYCSILNCTYGSLLFGDLKRKRNLVLRKDKTIFKTLTDKEMEYADALEITMKYFTEKGEK